jgi:fructose-1,6-bisphosphatase/inositol monophosphatase family enzyme
MVQRAAVGSECAVTSLSDLLLRCIVAGVAARNFVHAVFLQDGVEKIKVTQGASFAHKPGQDVVSVADVHLQELIYTTLSAKKYLAKFTVEATGRYCAFELVGEEAIKHNPDSASSDYRFDAYIAAAETSEQVKEATTLLQGVPKTKIGPHDSYSVIIDPIDATSAFVKGQRDAPMTLIGIAKNGIPIGGVAVRVFDQAKNGSLSASLSWCVIGGPCVLDGLALATLPAVTETAAPFRVTHSPSTSTATHKDVLARLGTVPKVALIPAVGAGHKLMMVVHAAAAARGVKLPHSYGEAEVFASTTGLHLWDTCAAHSFVRWFGGEIFCVRLQDPYGVRYGVTYVAGISSDAMPEGHILLAVSSPAAARTCVEGLLRGSAPSKL